MESAFNRVDATVFNEELELGWNVFAASSQHGESLSRIPRFLVGTEKGVY